MPGMDGYEATKLIRAWERTKGRPAMPIIAVTAMDPAQAATKTKDAGCTTFVSKPLKPAVLAEAICKVLGREPAAATATRRGGRATEGSRRKVFQAMGWRRSQEGRGKRRAGRP